MKTYQKLAHAVAARLNCIKTSNEEWIEKHEEIIENIIENLPHGSGIDGKTELDYNKSTGEKLVITSKYHAMNENGFYDGWITFTLTVKPSLIFELSLSIAGNFGKYQDVKDYLLETFDQALNEYEFTEV